MAIHFNYSHSIIKMIYCTTDQVINEQIYIRKVKTNKWQSIPNDPEKINWLLDHLKKMYI